MIDIKKETAERMKDIAPKEVIFQLFSVGLITEHSARRFLIVTEYEKAQPERGMKDHTKDRIADEFCVSPDTVKKYLCKKVV
jgi:hypothetical protein